MARPETVDAIVIGAGVVGMLTALELAHRGMKVRLVDQSFAGPVRTAVGEVAPLGSDDLMVGFNRFCVNMWNEAGARYGADFGLATRGSLDLATTEGRANMLQKEANAEALDATTYISNPKTVAEKWGGPVGEAVLGAKWSPNTPVISTHTVLESLRQAVMSKGILVWGEDKVTEFLPDGDRIVGIRVDSGDASAAEHVVVTASGVAGKLLVTLGLNLPLRPARKHILNFQPAPEHVESIGYPLLVHRLRHGHMMLKRTREGSVIMAYDGIMDALQATFSNKPDDKMVDALRSHVGSLLPTLAGAEVTQVSTFTGSVTPDFRPAIGPWGGIPGLFLCTGLSARNYAFAAAAARVTGEMLAKEKPSFDMFPFAPDRFANGFWKQTSHPPSLAWHEPAKMVDIKTVKPEFAANVTMDQVIDPDYADEVRMVGKTVHRNMPSNVQQKERQITMSSGKPNMPGREEGKGEKKGKLKMSTIKLS